jgi:hypothetical protein
MILLFYLEELYPNIIIGAGGFELPSTTPKAGILPLNYAPKLR